MFKDAHYCVTVKIISARNVPGSVSGVTPAANVICGVANRTENTHSVVSCSPIWNSGVEFSGVSRKDKVLFLLRDGDQILGSVQLSVKDCETDTVVTRTVDLLSQQNSECTLSFLLTMVDKSAFSKKRLLTTTRRLKASMFQRFASDPNLSVGAVEAPRNVSNLHRFSHGYVNADTRSRYSRESSHYVGRQADISPPRSSATLQREKRVLVIIQGRNLGRCPGDIACLTVGGVDRTADITHVSPDRIMLRLPRSAQMSPVTVATKSGGVGHQSARARVTYESACSSDDLLSTYCQPAQRTQRVVRNSGQFSTTSDSSGSDGLSVNRKLAPPPRRRRSSSGSSSFESASVLSRPVRPITPTPLRKVSMSPGDIIAPPEQFNDGAVTEEDDVANLYRLSREERVARGY